MAEQFSIDDFDWGSGVSEPPPVSSPGEPAPPSPPTTSDVGVRRDRGGYDIDPELLPQAYREYGTKNVYKRKRPPLAAASMSVDDFDWGVPEEALQPSRYNPDDDWAITRGFKTAYEGAADAMGGSLDMAEVAMLPADQQVAAMLAAGKAPRDPEAARLKVEGATDIRGVGDFITWLGESVGSTAGSWIAAAQYGGVPTAAAGAGIGAGVGALGAGVGAGPGAVAGGATGFTYGTLGAFGVMGVGGMYQDLLRDQGVQTGLENGSIDPGTIMKWSLIGGSVIGALDAFPAKKFVDRVGGKELTTAAVKKTITQAVLAGAKRQMVEEGGTEFLQGAISELEQALIGGDINAVERSLSAINQGLAGAVGGAGPGAVGGAVENARIPNQAAPQPPGTSGGTGTPPAPAPPGTGGLPTPGGTGVVAPPPPGAGTAGQQAAKAPTTPPVGATSVPAGAVPPDIEAALGAEEEGDFEPGIKAPTGLAAQLGVTPSPAAPAAPPSGVEDESLSAALSAGEEDLYRTGESAYQPGAQPAPNVPVEVAPQVPATPVPPQAPAPVPAVPAAPVPAIRPPREREPEELPLPGAETVQEPAPGPGQLYPSPEGAPGPIQQLTEPMEEVEEEPGARSAEEVLADYAAALDINERTDLIDAARRLQELRSNSNLYEIFWENLQPEMQDALSGELEAYTAPEIPVPAPQERPQERVQRFPRRKEPPEVPARPEAVEIAPEAQPEGEVVQPERRKVRTVPLRVTPKSFAGRSEEAQQDLLRAARTALETGRAVTVRDPKTHKKIGTVRSIDGEVQVDWSRGAAPAKVADEAVREREFTKRFQALQAGAAKAGKKKAEAIEAGIAERIARRQAEAAKLPRPKEFKKADIKARLKKLAKFDVSEADIAAAKEAAAKAREVTPAQIESFRKQARTWAEAQAQKAAGGLTTEQLFERYIVEAAGAAREATGGEIEAKPTLTQARIARLRRHFEAGAGLAEGARPVKLLSLGMKQPEIAALEARGFAHDGSMSAAEFDLWEKSELGAVAPPRTRPYVERELTKKQTYIEMPTAIEREKQRAERLAKLEEETAAQEAAEQAAYEKRTAEFQAAIDRTIERYKSGKIDEEQKIEEQIKANDKRIAAEEAIQKERTGKVSGMTAAAMKLQTPEQIRRVAYNERRKPKARQDPLLIRMAELLDRIKRDHRNPKKKATVAMWRRSLERLQQDRIKAQAKKDAAAAKAEAKEAADAIKRDQKFGEMLAGMVSRGEMDQDTADFLRRREKGAERYAKKREREKKTGPVLRKAIAEAKMPTSRIDELAVYRPRGKRKYFSAKERERRAARSARELEGMDISTRYNRDLRIWALGRMVGGEVIPGKRTRRGKTFGREVIGGERVTKGWIARTIAALKAAGVETLPRVKNSVFNTPEENGLLFIREIFEGAKKAGDEVGRRTTMKASYGDAAMVMHLLQGIQSRALPKGYKLEEGETRAMAVDRYRRSLIDAMYGMMFDAAVDVNYGVTPGVYTQRQLEEQMRAFHEGMTEQEQFVERERFQEAVEPGTRKIEEAASEDEQSAEKLREDILKWAESKGYNVRYSAAPAGWDVIENEVQRLSEEDQRTLEGIVQQASGLSSVEWHDRIEIDPETMPQGAARWGITEKGHTAGGAYHFLRDAMALALDTATPRAAYHEAFHRLQNLFLSDKEKAVLAAERERLRAIVRSAMGREEAADRMDQLELEAEAFAITATLGELNAPPVIQRAWNRIATMIRRVKNFLRGRGFQTSEDIFNAAKEGKIKNRPMRVRMAEEEARYAVNPTTSLRGAADIVKKVQQGWERRRAGIASIGQTTEDLRNSIAQRYFDGRFDNPSKDLLDALEEHPQLVANEMAKGDEMDAAIRRWWLADPGVRKQQVADMHELVVEASLDHIDPRVDLAGNPHIFNDPTKPKRYRHDVGLRAAHARYKAQWDAMPQELRDLMSPRLDHMRNQMRVHVRKALRNFLNMMVNNGARPVVLPGTIDAAIAELMSRQVTPALKAALGKNLSTLQDVVKADAFKGIYAPATRSGDYFISGRYKVATPPTQHGLVAFDQQAMDDRGIHRWVFSDERDADAYVEKMGQTGEQRVLTSSTWYMDPTTGLVATKKGPQHTMPIYYVRLQDRFMEMGDQGDLEARAKALENDPDVDHVTTPKLLAAERSISAGSQPLQIGTMLKNLDNLSGVSAQEKALVEQALTAIFIRSQQGNRITKKLLKRQGVAGYLTGADEMTASFKTNNEMMSRDIVSLDRIPKIKAADKRWSDWIDAVSRKPGAMQKLTAAEQAQVQRLYAKDEVAARMSEDHKEVMSRIEAHMQPSGGTKKGDQLWQALFTSVTSNYLASMAYFALQVTGVALQTFPRMVGEMAVRHNVPRSMSMAGRYMWSAANDINWLGNMASGVFEGLAEGGHFLKGFVPRQGFWDSARPVRRSKDFLADVIDRMRANGVNRLDGKIAMLLEARDRGQVGMAGLDQLFLKVDLSDKWRKTNKFLRANEQVGRIFRGLQEGIEINNRVIPMLAYYDYFMDIGYDEAQARALAINKMSREQVGYKKENWPAWMSNLAQLGPFSRIPAMAMMFKKFPLQQVTNYWDSLLRSFGSNPEDVRRARVEIAMMTMVLATAGGFVGNPLWEPLRYLFMLLSPIFFGNRSWDELKTESEKLLATYIGTGSAEVLMYGAPRALGVDMSNRVALDSLLFYRQPQEMTREEWWAIAGQMTGGAPGAMIVDSIATSYDALNGDKSWPKWLSSLPAPKVVKDIFKAYDLYQNGPTTATGVSTGKPVGVMDALVTSAGFRTRAQARPFEVGSAAAHRTKERISNEREALTRRILNEGLTGTNVRRVRDWNRSHGGKDERITLRDLSQARKRRRKTELDIMRENLKAGIR